MSIASNDLKKGAVIRMRGTGWRGTIADNAKGNIRMATIEGVYTETGSVYVWDIKCAIINSIDVPIALTEKQAKDRTRIKAMGF